MHTTELEPNAGRGRGGEGSWKCLKQQQLQVCNMPGNECIAKCNGDDRFAVRAWDVGAPV